MTFLQRLKYQFLIKLVVYILKLTGGTSRVKIEQAEQAKEIFKQYQTVIVVLWHEDIYFSIFLLQHLNLTSLSSRSKDGDAICEVTRHFGMKAIRGSTTRGGIGALKQSIQTLNQGNSVVVTPDGPKGPAHQIKTGALFLAKKTGLPIMPFHYEGSQVWRASSWDRQKIPLPFGKIFGRFGEPLFIPASCSDQELSDYAQKLKKFMQENQQYCLNHFSKSNINTAVD